jgi:dihydroxyacid dehydratase/phosphogluconate dehydratase
VDGCVVKTSGVDEDIHRFSGPAHVCRVRRRPSATFWRIGFSQAM